MDKTSVVHRRTTDKGHIVICGSIAGTTGLCAGAYRVCEEVDLAQDVNFLLRGNCTVFVPQIQQYLFVGFDQDLLNCPLIEQFSRGVEKLSISQLLPTLEGR